MPAVFLLTSRFQSSQVGRKTWQIFQWFLAKIFKSLSSCLPRPNPPCLFLSMSSILMSFFLKFSRTFLFYHPLFFFAAYWRMEIFHIFCRFKCWIDTGISISHSFIYFLYTHTHIYVYICMYICINTHIWDLFDLHLYSFNKDYTFWNLLWN